MRFAQQQVADRARLVGLDQREIGEARRRLGRLRRALHRRPIGCHANRQWPYQHLFELRVACLLGLLARARLRGLRLRLLLRRRLCGAFFHSGFAFEAQNKSNVSLF